MKMLVVGSSVIDLFLSPTNPKQYHLKDQSVTFTLGDKVPIDIQRLALGGNGANVSVGMARFGIPTVFYTYIGSDILSQEIAENITREGVEIVTEKGKGHSSLSLIFNFTTDRIIYSHHPVEKHDFTYSDPSISHIYLTSIGDPWETALRKVINYSNSVKAHLAFSPGSAQLARMNDLFFETIHSSSSLFINKEEAERILTAFGSARSNIHQIMTELLKLGPSLVSVTDGKNGAYAIDKERKIYHLPPFSSDGVHEKTGAGDAYATGFLAALLKNKPLAECMRTGALSSHTVMKEVGATTGLPKEQDMLQLLKKHTSFQPIILK